MTHIGNFSSLSEAVDLQETVNFSIEEFLLVSREYQSDDHWFSKEAEYPIIISFVILICVGLATNSVLFYIIASKGRHQSSRNWYILNLAASDILTCAVCKPLTVVRLVMKNWVLGETLCKLVTSLQTVYVFVSTFTLVALAVDRYSAIIYNKHQTRSKHCVFVCLSFIWTASFCISIPMVVVHDIEHVKGFNGNVLYSLCTEKWESETARTFYNVLVLLLQYLSPLVAIVVLHLFIGKFLGSRLPGKSADDASIRRKQRRHRKNIILLSTIAIAFGVAWFPLHFINALVTLDYSLFSGIDFPLLHALCVMLAFTSVCLNPVIYGLLNTNVQRDFAKICGGYKPHFTFYTDYTRRSSPNQEQLGLISSAPNELVNSSGNFCKTKSCNHVSVM